MDNIFIIMKQQINEFKRMQQLAGVVNESEYQEKLINEAEISNSEIYEYVSKNYKSFIAPGVQKMLEGLDKKFNNLNPKQQKLVFEEVSKIMKYQMEVWNN